MTRLYDSSVGSPNSSERSDIEDVVEEPLIRIRKIPPKILGMNLTVVMTMFYMTSIIITAFHCALILQTTFDLVSGYMVTVFFGLLGPTCVMYWVITGMFAYSGSLALFLQTKDYFTAASYFRRWSRASRFLLLAMILNSTQYFFGCYMFATGTSLHTIVTKNMDLKGIDKHRPTRQAVEGAARIYDTLAYSNPNDALTYPLNFIHFSGRQWGLIMSVMGILPICLVMFGIRAQELYYNWRFAPTGIRID